MASERKARAKDNATVAAHRAQFVKDVDQLIRDFRTNVIRSACFIYMCRDGTNAMQLYIDKGDDCEAWVALGEKLLEVLNTD